MRLQIDHWVSGIAKTPAINNHNNSSNQFSQFILDCLNHHHGRLLPIQAICSIHPLPFHLGTHHIVATILIAQNNHRLLNNGSSIQTHVGHHMYSHRPQSRASTLVHPTGDSITPNTHLGPKPALPTLILSSHQQPESSLHTKKKLRI